jgi:hypothetical protein
MARYTLRGPVEAVQYHAAYRQQFAAKLAAMHPKARMTLPARKWAYFCLSVPGLCNLFVHDGQWVTWDGVAFAARDGGEFHRLFRPA